MGRREQIATLLENVECGKQLLDLIMSVGLDSCPLRSILDDEDEEDRRMGLTACEANRVQYCTKGFEVSCPLYQRINAAIKGENDG